MNGSEKSSAEADQAPSAPEDSQTPNRLSFALGTTATDLDPRIHAIRGDIADIALADRIALPNYVSPIARQVCVPVADLRSEPSDTAELGSQLLHGEQFAWLDTVDGWAWGYGIHDHFVGFVRQSVLGPVSEPSHIVSSVSASVSGGSSAIDTLYMGSPVSGEVAGDSLQMADGGAVAMSDLKPLDAGGDDPAGIAEMFGGAPYLLGGRSMAGIDCSGLVQIALAMVGIPVQRDSDLQQETIGDPLPEDADLQRGDLIFFPEHVGIMLNDKDFIHATGHAGAVVTEPLSDVVSRIAADHDPAILARRRISR